MVMVIFWGIVPGIIGLIALTVATSVVEGLGFPSTPMLVSAAVAEDRQASAQGLMVAVEVATGAVAALVTSAVYATHGDTVAWTATAVTMGLLLSIGAILTRPDDRRPVRPGIPTDPTRRPFR